MSKLNEMPFLEHLSDLRQCLLKTILGIFTASILAYFFSNDVFRILTEPIRDNFSELELIGTGPAEAFVVKLKTALICGIILSCPFTFLQLWNFISPALHQHEKKLTIPFVFVSSIFFFLGIVFCYYTILPFAFKFFQKEYLSIGIEANIKIGEYLSFVTKLLLIFGAVFELPVLSFIFAKLGILTDKWLISKFRYVIVLAFALAAVLTPPDIITQILLASALIVFYGICILVTYCVNKTPSKESSITPNKPIEKNPK